MKVLLVNNFHYLRGGAERSYFDTAEILESKGHEVAFFSTARPNNYPGSWNEYFVNYFDLEAEYGFKDKLRIVGRILYNREAQRRIRSLIKKFQPDVAHLHNVYHHLSPSVIRELKRWNVPVVMTLHDYKLVCPNYNLFVRGRIWEKSKKRKYYRCIRDRCVKDSYLKSLICALEAYVHRIWGIYHRVDEFISPSRFLIDKFREFGFKKDIYHLPHPVLAEEDESDSVQVKEKYILFFGRLSEEKGIRDLIEAYSRALRKIPELKLKIAGDGPQKGELMRLIKEKGLEDGIMLIGSRQWYRLQADIKGAEAVVFPFKWYENYPYAVLEAQKLGKKVICSDIGGVSEMIEDGYNGFLYEPGNIEQLSEIIEKTTAEAGSFPGVEANAENTVTENNNKEDFYNELMGIYNHIIHNK